MAMISSDYERFLKESTEMRKLSFYEAACNTSEKILPIQPWKGLKERYTDAIKFCHIRITPRGAFSFAILATLVATVAPILLAFALGVLTSTVAILTLVLTAALFYYLYDYPFHFSIVFRIKASSEMILAVVYMTISMRISPNVENAILFAAENLTGPLALDLRQLIWDIYTRKYDSMEAGVDEFISKWRVENEEFAEALYILKTATFESAEKTEHALNEVISIILNGTKERMNTYAQDLRTPVTVFNALGIVLPIMGMVFFPIMALFMPDVIQPAFLALGYDVILPLAVYWTMKTSLERRPYSFHQPDVSRHPKFVKGKNSHYFLMSLAVAAPVIAFAIYKLAMLPGGRFGMDYLTYSLIITIGLSALISIYCILPVIKKTKMRSEIVQIESEFAESLFQVGQQLSRGIPIETTLKNIVPRIEKMKISDFYKRILYNIEAFGMTFEQAIFDEKIGAIRDYPSKQIEAIMKAIVEISKRGMSYASKAMMTISRYLKDVHKVEEKLKDMLSEVTSTMEIQAILLAPLSAGVVVALAALIMDMMFALKGAFESVYGTLSGYGPVGAAGGSVITSLFNLDQMIPVHIFQMIVGIYMIEVVVMLAIFLSIINNGDEDILKRYKVGKSLILSTAIYSVIVMLLYSVFTSLIPLSGLIK